MESVHCHETTDLDEVSQTEGFLELVVQAVCLTRDIDVGPELFLDGIDLRNTFLQAFCRTPHTYEVPHDEPQLFVDRIHGAVTLDSHEFVDLVLNSLLCLSELRQIRTHTRNTDLVAQVVLNRIRKYEVTICETLHQSRSTKTVSTVVREVRLTDTEQTLDGRL